MKKIDISTPESAVRFAGIIETTNTSGGTRLSRLTARALAQSNDVRLPIVTGMPSGGRLEFTTDATNVVLTCQVTTLRVEDKPVNPVVCDLVVDGELVSSCPTESYNVIFTPDRTSPTVEIIQGDTSTFTFSGISPGAKNIELWLPANALVEIHSLELNDDASIETTPLKGVSWFHYGSSISHCMEAEQPTGVWPVVAARMAGVRLTNLGFGGQCHLDQFVARIIRDSDADIISMKVGINVVNMDSLRERSFIPALHGFLDTVREGKPATPIIVASPIYCSFHENDPGPSLPQRGGGFKAATRTAGDSFGSLTLIRARELIEKIVKERCDDGDKNLHFIDGLSLFGAADEHDMPDLLHPNAAGYRRLGQRFHKLAFVEGPFNV